MEKKDSKEQKKKGIAHHVQKINQHLSMKIGVPVVAIIIVVLVFVLFVVKVPYNAKESYVATESYTENVAAVVPDTENPIQDRVCDEQPSKVDITELSVYKKPFGLNAYKCYASFKVRNQDSNEGKWAYGFTFNVSGRTVPVDAQTQYIAKYASIVYNFESDVCQEGDTVTGFYNLVSSPTSKTCHYETIYPNKTITRAETKQRQVPTERQIVKYETLLQSILGANRAEKV